MQINESRHNGLEQSTRLFKALADPVRLRLLGLLEGADEICVCHLHSALDLPQPTVSRHLAYLRNSGLVRTRRAGLWVYYRLAEPSSSLHRTLLGAIGLCFDDPDVLTQDRERLARVLNDC